MKLTKYTLILVGILILASALMLFRLETKSYWGDEIFSVTHIQKDVWSILVGEDEPGNPPLYFLLLHYWIILFGTGEFAVRFLSVIFGVLSVYVTYNLGKLFFGEKEGLVSAFLLLVSHTFIAQAQDARAYTLFTFLSLLSLYFFWKMMKSGENKYLLAYVLSTVLALCSHYSAFLVVVIEFIFFVIQRKAASISTKKFFSVLSILFVLYLPFTILFVGNAIDRVKSNTEEESIVRAAELWGIDPSTAFFGILAAFSNTKYAIPLFLLPLLYGTYACWKTDKEKYLLLGLWVLLPVVAVFLLSFKMILGFKYIIFTFPVFLLLVSKGLTSIKNVSILALLLLLMLGSAGVRLADYYGSEKQDWRSAATFVDANVRTDMVVVQPHWARKYFWFYSNLNQTQIKGITEENGLPSKTIEVSSNNTRVWVVYSDENKMFDVNERIVDWLDKNCGRRAEFAEITVYLCSS